ncbi:hypothetical protein PSEUBRA_003717 [Kalmanozyma brasiliensis GHG001]|uniref:uncharacterized protein n=1 Tax=Kalmanozyma brasiliensis (strain GHG001) TaxID=1365824 RepID=UPI0028681A4B|nr:uncharacterized protein PSEUBRA_003717 [Kalmanozyma brasiliensis GHG001]KAF6767280.1 hypothetical protein PSEUBRA_003717 [Kalmanozyma brasiliensis GHG001]
MYCQHHPKTQLVPASHLNLRLKTIVREGERLDPSIATPDEVTHAHCAGSVFARVLQGNTFLKSSNATLRTLNKLKRSTNRSRDSPNALVYEDHHYGIVDIFCLLDYHVMPLQGDPLSRFKLVTRLGKEKLPRPPLKILIQSLRFDISTLSELLRRDICTVLRPEEILEHSPDFLRQRFRVIRAVQNLYAEHSIMLAPSDDAFFFRDCKVCSKYDPEIIRFGRDLYRLLLRIFHGEPNRPISIRYFTPKPETSEPEMTDDEA